MRQSPSPRVVIVAARNEGERIGATLGPLAVAGFADQSAGGFGIALGSRWSIDSSGTLPVAFSSALASFATSAAPREPGAR
jgi:hypothetical protein